MSEAQSDSSARIKKLESRKGRIWGFIRRRPKGEVQPLSPFGMVGRLRHLLMSTVKTISSYVRSNMGERTLREMFDHQAEEFASHSVNWNFGADQIAEKIIQLNFQPLGIKAEYSGDREAARIVVSDCPLPQRYMQDPELLLEIYESEDKGFKELLSLGDSLTAKGEWPPKRPEACSLCRVVIPRVGQKTGFTWEHGMTDDKPPRCFFNISKKSE